MSQLRLRAAGAVAMVALVAAIAPAPALAAADAPNTCAGATTAAPANTWIVNTIQSAADQDWYRFTVPVTRYHQVLLGAMTKNYRLELYSACGTSAKFISDRGGVQYEEVYKSLGGGTWYARVSSPNGVFDTVNAYKLKFRPLANRLVNLSSAAWVDSSGYLNIVGEILNNTGTTFHWVNVYAMLINSADEVIGAKGVSADLDYLLPRNRTAFSMQFKKPAGYVRYELVFGAETTTDKPVAGLRVVPGTPYTSYGTRYLPGTISNTGVEISQYTFVSCVLYDSLGGVMNADWTYTNPTTVNPGGSAPFKCWFYDHWSGANRTAFAVEGD